MRDLLTCDLRSESWCAPIPPPEEVLLYDEPGRVLVLKPESNHDVCFQAYYFRVTQHYGLTMLYVKHGGGQESFRLSCAMSRAFAGMTSDQRYFTCHAIMDAYHEGQKHAGDTYRQAHAEGRLKRRINRRAGTCKVWIESRITS